jgi:thiol-disulfide isomerase/thioredoxin
MLFFLLLNPVLSLEWWEASEAKDITQDNYEEYIGRNKHVVLEFYSPFCHYCKMMHKEYEELAVHYNGPDSPWKSNDILIARVNGAQNQKLALKYNIYGYPTIIFIPAFSLEAKSTFNKARLKFEFIEWIEEQAKNNVIENLVDENQAKDPLEVLEVLEHEDKENHDHPDRENELMQFEMLIEDVSSHNSDKWRGEFNNLSIQVEDIKKIIEIDHGEIIFAVQALKSGVNEQILTLLKKIEDNQTKLDEIMTNVINRNNIENTQSRFNFTHMVVFVTLGAILGFGFSVYLVKIKPSKEYNKV